MKNCKISIAMTTYNGEKYIEKQLLSILKQTVVVDEVIICDDVSTDNTVQIIKSFISEYNLKNWKVFINSYNLGYKINFYNAIKKTTGDYIFLADQDDEWLENKIEKMISIFESNSNILSLNSVVELIDSKSNLIDYKCHKRYYNCDFLYSEYSPKELECYDFLYLTKHNISPGCTMAITRNLANIFLKCYKFEIPHDWFLNMIAARKGGCYFFNAVTVKYRKHSNNVIGTNNGIVCGIKKKTRNVRIEDYEARTRVIKSLLNNDTENKEILNVINLYRKMIDFYQKPAITKLLNIRKIPAYYELSKKKIRMWEIIVALNIDILITGIISKKMD